MRRDLDIVRNIRNAFAHAAVPISFRTEEISRECKGLKSFDSLRKHYESKIAFKESKTDRQHFINTVLILVIFLGEELTMTLKRKVRRLQRKTRALAKTIAS